MFVEEAALYVEEALGALRFLLWTWHEPAAVPDDQAGERQLELDVKVEASSIDEFVGDAPWRKHQRQRHAEEAPAPKNQRQPPGFGENGQAEGESGRTFPREAARIGPSPRFESSKTSCRAKSRRQTSVPFLTSKRTSTGTFAPGLREAEDGGSESAQNCWCPIDVGDDRCTVIAAGEVVHRAGSAPGASSKALPRMRR